MRRKNLTLGQRLAGTFGVVLAMLFLICLANYIGVERLAGSAETSNGKHRLDAELAQREADHLNWVAAVDALFVDEDVSTLEVETDHTRCALGQWLYGAGRKRTESLMPYLAPQLKEIEQSHQRLHASAAKIGRLFQKADPAVPQVLAEIAVAHLLWAERIREAIGKGQTALPEGEADSARCSLARWAESVEGRRAYGTGTAEFQKLFDGLTEVHNRLHESVGEIEELLSARQFAVAAASFDAETVVDLQTMVAVLQEMSDGAKIAMGRRNAAKRIYVRETVPALHDVQQTLHSIRRQVRSALRNDEGRLASARRTTKLAATVFGFVSLVAMGLLAGKTGYGIIRNLREAVRQIDDGSLQLAVVSDQIATGSQGQAEGASQQAAALQQTSASLEEVGAMSKQDAENARQADELIKTASRVIGNADLSMQRLTDSMAAISRASSDTQKIVKTIDEIAFQTNILALNAAVEAARAGEQGQGFAVVANEVRGLAMRAAEAAQSTNALIENTVRQVSEGGKLVAETSSSFGEAAESIHKSATLVAEIADSTREQATALEQINQAVDGIDAVTQHNAAMAEEAASASEELRLQAEALKGVVVALVRMIGGGSRTGPAAPVAEESGMESKVELPALVPAVAGAPAGTTVETVISPAEEGVRF